MAESSANVFFKKTSDGKTKKVLVRRIRKTIKLKKIMPKPLPVANAAVPAAKSAAPATPQPAAAKTRRSSQKQAKIFIAKKTAKRGGSFERASSKRKLKRPARVMPYDGRPEEEPRGFLSERSDDAAVYANVPKKIEIGEVIAITELARKLNLKAAQLIKKFFSLGVMNLRVSDNIDTDAARIVCSELNCEVSVVSLVEQTKVEVERGAEGDYEPRPVILTTMGHVDHGKTTLLAALTGREQLAEAGGITQQVTAHTLTRERSAQMARRLVFLDTPGHSAFFSMRAKGVKVTDFLIVIMAVTEGVKPQTLEVLTLNKTAQLPMVIVATKLDLLPVAAEREQALTKLKQVLGKYEVALKEWGGTVPFFAVSAKTGEGIQELMTGLEALAEEAQLTGNPKVRAYGYVLETQVVTGEGNVITTIIQNGTMRVGDAYLCHKAHGRVRAIYDETDAKVQTAGPGAVVRVIGLAETIPSGQFFQIMENERAARVTAEKRYELEQLKAASNVKKITVSNLFSTMQKEQVKELRLIVKADTYGSAEAISETLKQLRTAEVRTQVIHFGVGSVTENEIQLAVTTASQLIVFKLKLQPKLKVLAVREGVRVDQFSVIYDIIDQVKEQLTGMLDKRVDEQVEARLEVLELFKLAKLGRIAGCKVLTGKLSAKHQVRVFRDDALIHTGTLATLRRFKNEAAEVVVGDECGLTIKNFENFQVGDVVEAFTTKVTKRTLELDEPTVPTPETVSSVKS